MALFFLTSDPVPKTQGTSDVQQAVRADHSATALIGNATLHGAALVDRTDTDNSLTPFPATTIFPRKLARRLVNTQTASPVKLFQLGGGSHFFNRIHFDPGFLDLGNLLTNQKRDLFIYNAHFQTVPLETIGTFQAGGINLDLNGSVMPVQFGAMEELMFSFTISTSGPPIINADYSFIFAAEFSNDDRLFNIKGSRANVWSFPPNWDDVLTEKFKFNTSVVTYWSGKEQRTPIRMWPKCEIDFTIGEKDGAAEYLKNLIWGWQGRAWAIPLWQHAQQLQAAVEVGTEVVAFNSVDRPMAVGGLLVMWSTPFVYEVREILSFTDTHVTLQLPTENYVPSTGKVMPAVTGFMAKSTQLQYETDSYLKGSIKFELAQSSLVPIMPPPASPATYQGVDLWMKVPDWADDLPIHSWNRYHRKPIDFGFGEFNVGETNSLPHESMTKTWKCFGIEEIQEFKQFFLSTPRQAKTFWMPSWKRDFEIGTLTLASSNDIEIIDRGYSQFVNTFERTVKRHVMIVLADGTIFLREILVMTLSGGLDIWTMDANFGQDVQPHEVIMACFLDKYVVDEDMVQLEYPVIDLMRAMLKLRIVEE